MFGRISAQAEAVLENNVLEGKEANHLQKILNFARLKFAFLTGDKEEPVVANVDLAPERSIQKNESPADTRMYIDREPVQQISINEMYEKYSLETDGMNTIYMIEKFINALPDLPAGIKRQSVINLIAASQLDMLKLLQDGSHRLEALNQYDHYFSKGWEEEIEADAERIDKLMEQIAYHNRIIEEKKKIKAAQLAEIQFEMQKIAGIMDFIGDGKVKKEGF